MTWFLARKPRIERATVVLVSDDWGSAQLSYHTSFFGPDRAYRASALRDVAAVLRQHGARLDLFITMAHLDIDGQGEAIPLRFAEPEMLADIRQSRDVFTPYPHGWTHALDAAALGFYRNVRVETVKDHEHLLWREFYNLLDGLPIPEAAQRERLELMTGEYAHCFGGQPSVFVSPAYVHDATTEWCLRNLGYTSIQGPQVTSDGQASLGRPPDDPERRWTVPPLGGPSQFESGLWWQPRTADLDLHGRLPDIRRQRPVLVERGLAAVREQARRGLPAILNLHAHNFLGPESMRAVGLGLLSDLLVHLQREVGDLCFATSAEVAEPVALPGTLSVTGNGM